jgi:inositol-hexakisphosphate/diphosphoinositol-pentakisphosphate 1-kinase
VTSSSRVPGKSYVCDVNGWSFVKSSKKYYDDCARVLNEMMLTAMRTNHHHHPSSLLSQHPRRRLSRGDRSSSAPALESPSLSSSPNSRFRLDRHSLEPLTPDSPELDYSCEGLGDEDNDDDDEEEELLCVLSVIRHGDRTPKQKIKIKFCQERFLDFYHRNTPSSTTNIKLKSKSTLLEFLEIVKQEIFEMEKQKCGDSIASGREAEGGGRDYDHESYAKLCCIRDVLEDREIHGLTRKIQFKPEKWSAPPEDLSLLLLPRDDDDDLFFPSPASASATPSTTAASSPMGRGPISRGSRSGMTKSTMSSPSNGNGKGVATQVLCIVKWGGDLTPLGEKQAELLGENFRRTMYPDPSGDGILRMHSTFRHDLKIKASDEGRVMRTAAAFTKGLLELEGDLTPVMVSLVTVQEKNTQMLDHHDNTEVKCDLDSCKGYLNQILQLDTVMTMETIEQLLPDCDEVLRENLLRLENPREKLRKMHLLIKEVIGEVRRLSDLTGPKGVGVGEEEKQEGREILPLPAPASAPSPQAGTGVPCAPYLNETFILMLDRWMKLDSAFFRSKDDLYDLSKVPELHDMARYDVLHNSHLLFSPSPPLPLNELYQVSKLFADCVVPQEYGITNSDKRSIGRKMCHALLHKIQYDLMVAQSGSNVDMQCMPDESHGDELNIQSMNHCLRTRLYFTSESHLYTLFHVLGYPAAAASASSPSLPSASAFSSPTSPSRSTADSEATWTSAGGAGVGDGSGGGGPFFDPDHVRSHHKACELAYLSHLTIRLFGNKLASFSDANKYRCELLLSPGAVSDPCQDKTAQVSPAIVVNKNINCKELIGYLQEAISGYETSLLPRARSDGDSEMMLC